MLEKTPPWRGSFDGGSQIRVVACPNPFSTAREIRHLRAGLTLGEIVEIAAPQYAAHRVVHVLVGDVRFPDVIWQARPKPGQTVYLRAVPAGGEGKNALRTLLQLAVIAASVHLGPVVAGIAFEAGSIAFTIASAVATAGLGTVGTLLVNAIAPPPRPSTNGLTGLDATQSPSLQGLRNQVDRWGVEPTVLGTFRFAPRFAGLPYTEIGGDDQYVRALFLWGHSNLTFADFRIGNTPTDRFQDVQTETKDSSDNFGLR